MLSERGQTRSRFLDGADLTRYETATNRDPFRLAISVNRGVKAKAMHVAMETLDEESSTFRHEWPLFQRMVDRMAKAFSAAGVFSKAPPAFVGAKPRTKIIGKRKVPLNMNVMPFGRRRRSAVVMIVFGLVAAPLYADISNAARFVQITTGAVSATGPGDSKEKTRRWFRDSVVRLNILGFRRHLLRESHRERQFGKFHCFRTFSQSGCDLRGERARFAANGPLPRPPF